MPVDLREITFIRQSEHWTPDLGAKLAELLTRFGSYTNNLEAQTNGNVQGPPQPPGKINGLSVTAQNGHFSVAIQDHNELYRGVKYFVEHADNPHFTNPTTVEIGTTRNANLFLGNVNRYFRAYSAYSPSAPNDPVYHGGAQPTLVNGGGAVGGPPAVETQGSGTGPAGTGLEGPGKVPWRSGNGAPPTR